MNFTPLRNSDYLKLIAFIIVMLPTVMILGIGLIPLAFLTYGVVSAKDDKNFVHIEKAVSNSRNLYSILLVIALMSQLYEILHGEWDLIPFLLVSIGVWAFYIVSLNRLFLLPLVEHKGWIVENGIFSKRSECKNSVVEDNTSKNYIAGHTLSVPDELSKWIDLKKNGHITEDEFQKAREKLLSRT